MLRPRSIPFLACLLMILALAFSGCSDSTAPTDATGDLARIGAEGDLDPADGTFVLKTLQMPPPWDGPPISIELIGSNLVTDIVAETVSLDVAIRNSFMNPLYAPAVVWVEGFTPPEVSLINADYVLVPPAKAQGDTFAYFERFGFDYSELIGDGVLDTGETSAAKTWIFSDPGLGSFSFRGWAEFGTTPNLPRIGGRCFVDENNNGLSDPGEPALGGSWVIVMLPNGDRADIMPDEEGFWSLPVEDPGLYEVRCDLMWAMPLLPCFTTPNPLEILLTPGPDGMPNGFEGADFGMCVYDPYPRPPILFTDVPPDSLHFGHWTLIDAHIDDLHYLRMHVGFSGCQPDHPFTLYASGGFMESYPPQINVVLVHEIEEDCDAWFDGMFVFDLFPLWERYLDAYGPGPLLLNLIMFDGTVVQLEFGIYPPD